MNKQEKKVLDLACKLLKDQREQLENLTEDDLCISNSVRIASNLRILEEIYFRAMLSKTGMKRLEEMLKEENK